MMFEVEVDVESNRILFLTVTEPLVDVDDNEYHDVGNGSPSATSTCRTNNHSSDDGCTSTYEHIFGDYLLLGLAAVSTLAICIFFALHPIHGHAFHPFGKSNNTNDSGGAGRGGPNNYSVMMMTTMMTTTTMNVGSTTNAATTITTTTNL
jgi:hypothetical protein